MMRIINKNLFFSLLCYFPLSMWAINKYDIAVSLNYEKRTIEGDITMVYENQSSDTLPQLLVQLWPNAYQDQYTPWAEQMVKLHRLDFRYGKTKGYIDSLNFNQEGKSLSLITSEEHPDMGVIVLNEPLLPHQSVSISTPFRVKLPQLYTRSGYLGSFYSVTQWYPKFAVYENGNWQALSYLEQGEFNSDFADYQVKVTLPKAYKFAATNYLYIPKDSSQSLITYEIIGKNLIDFAWFVSRKFTVTQKEITLPSGKKVMIQIYQENTDSLAMDYIQYATTALQKMSQWVGEYPFDVCTIVVGMNGLGSGMEYPSICTIAGDGGAKREITHEIVHNWWYGILANNERAEPFMDESITSYYENRIVNQQGENQHQGFSNKNRKGAKYFGINRLPEDALTKTILLHQYRKNLQQPINLPADQYSGINYQTAIYGAGALAVQNLEGYLGQSEFDALMHGFYHQYQFKRVSIETLKNYLIQHATKDVSWFFDSVLRDKSPTRIKIGGLKKADGRYDLTLDNQDTSKLSVQVAVVDKELKILESVWSDSFEGQDTLSLPEIAGAYAILADPQWLLPEENRRDNFYKLGGLKKIKPLQLKFLGGVEDPTKNQLFYTPILAGDKYDGFMLGMALYNRLFPAKKLEYELVPLYAFKSKQFNWIGNVAYHFTPKSQKPVEVKLGLYSKSFSMNDQPLQLKYIKLQPSLVLTYRKLNNSDGPIHQVGYRNVQIWADFYTAQVDSLNQVSFSKERTKFNTHEFWYSLEYNHALFPSYVKTTLRFDRDYIRQSVEYIQKFRMNKRGDFVYMRLFGGAFYYRNREVSFRRNNVVGFNLSGMDGNNDYLFDGDYFGRSEQEHFASRQLVMGEGNFKVLTPLQNPMEGKTVNGLIALNLKADIPVKWLPVQVFMDLGYSVDKVLAPDNFLPANKFHFDFGLNVSLFNEGLEVYFPLVMSKDFKAYYKSNLPKFGQRITFSINMDKINIHKRLRSDFLGKMF